MRDRDVLELGMRAARMAVRDEDFSTLLAEELHRIFGAGIGVTRWQLTDPRRGRNVVAGAAPLSESEFAELVTVSPQHPALAPSVLIRTAPFRFSDRIDLKAFWQTDTWWYMHGIRQGRYPAMLSLGVHDGEAGVVGLHHRSRDFESAEMDDLALLREPLQSGLEFRAAMRRACRQVGRMYDERGAPAGDTESVPLTARETEVLALVATGRTNDGVGQVLGISERTVRKHLGNVHAKLGLSNRTAAAVWFREQARRPPRD